MFKNLLLIMPDFHEYSNAIKKSIEKQGYKVDIKYDLSTNFLYAILDKTLPKISVYIKRYFNFTLKREFATKTYSKVLVIRGDGLETSFFEFCKHYNPMVELVLYQWDSLKNFNYLEFVDFFDKVYTFDSDDFEKYQHDLNFKYLPLFFSKNNQGYTEKDIDFTFIGGITVDRYLWLLKLRKNLSSEGYNFYFHMYIDFRVYITLLVRGIILNPKYIKFHSLSGKTINNIYLQTKVCIDLPHPEQSGLTMRTFESLACHCKLLTTNKNITKEDFYNPINIKIIDLHSTNIVPLIKELHSSKYIMFNKIEKYSIDNWSVTLLRD